MWGGYKMDSHTLKWKLCNELLATVVLELSRRVSRVEQTPLPTGDMTTDLFELNRSDSLVNRYILLAVGRLQNFVEDWWA